MYKILDLIKLYRYIFIDYNYINSLKIRELYMISGHNIILLSFIVSSILLWGYSWI